MVADSAFKFIDIYNKYGTGLIGTVVQGESGYRRTIEVNTTLSNKDCKFPRIMEGLDLAKFGDVKGSYTIITNDCCSRGKDVVLRVDKK